MNSLIYLSIIIIFTFSPVIFPYGVEWPTFKKKNQTIIHILLFFPILLILGSDEKKFIFSNQHTFLLKICFLFLGAEGGCQNFRGLPRILCGTVEISHFFFALCWIIVLLCNIWLERSLEKDVHPRG